MPPALPPTPCRLCRATVDEVVLDLGRQPSAETFPDVALDPADDPAYPLRMGLCGACGLAQLMEDPGTVEEQTMVVEPVAMTEQAEATLDFAAEHGLLVGGARAVELGSPHGGSLVDRLAERGLDVVAPDAADDAADGTVDLVVDVYGLLHDADQEAALVRRTAMLRDGGAMVLQLHTLAAVVEARQFSELRHGHFAYWSLPALDAALRRHGLGVHRARSYPLDGGTLAVVATATPSPDAETVGLLEAELAAGVTDPVVVRTLQDGADVATHALRDWLVAERDAGRSVVGYGAAGRAVPLLCHGGIDASLLPVVGDAARTKHGRRLPGTDIAIVPPDEAVARRPDRVVLFLGHLLDEMRRALPGVEAAGGRWVVLTPAPSVVEPG